jgi:hypothetical protein
MSSFRPLRNPKLARVAAVLLAGGVLGSWRVTKSPRHMTFPRPPQSKATVL